MTDGEIDDMIRASEIIARGGVYPFRVPVEVVIKSLAVTVLALRDRLEDAEARHE